MKLTWFGGTTIRVHIGGAILVVDAAAAPQRFDPTELVSGADHVIEEFGRALPELEAGWKPRKAPRLVDEGEAQPSVQVFSAGAGAILVDAMGEAPLLLIRGKTPDLGRWRSDAVVVVFGDDQSLLQRAQDALEATSPRLLVLAGSEAGIDNAFAGLRAQLDGTGLMALEAALALEV
jgi:hypothetical protein